MIKSINHIGIAVEDLEDSMMKFRKLLGFETVHRETIEDQMVTVASFKVGDVRIELTSPTSNNSPIAKFLSKRGEGIHHIAFESDNVKDELIRIDAEGINLIDKEPRLGAHDSLIAFLHPKSLNGVLTEICQKIKSD